MSFSLDGVPVPFQCLAALGFLATFLALRMSMFRLAGSPGEGKPYSALERMYEAQQLTAEWVPLGGFLIIANVMKNSKELELYVNYAAIAFTASRFLFAARYFLPASKPVYMAFGIPSMVTCYSATLLLASLLLCPV